MTSDEFYQWRAANTAEQVGLAIAAVGGRTGEISGGVSLEKGPFSILPSPENQDEKRNRS
jgi:hypothetical protein